jgi:DNA-binding beta-propeller fold protein YncE
MTKQVLQSAAVFVMAFLAIAVSACGPKPTTPTNTNSSKGNTVFVVNEGNFMWGNAMLSAYDKTSNSLANDVFYTKNNRHLGDLFQSMKIMGDKAYLLMDNANKIELMKLPEMTSISTISGIQSPRYMLPISDHKAYVSSIHADGVHVINLDNNSLTKKIACPGWTEHMLLSQGKVYIANMHSHYLYIADPIADVITDSVDIGYGTSGIVIDKNNQLWVSTTGKSDEHIAASIKRINPATKAITLDLPFSSGSASRLCMNKGGDKMFYLNGDVYALDISASALPGTALITAAGRNLYGLNLDPANDEIYISDAIDYVQSGVIYRYNASGTSILFQGRASIIPGDFCFY